MRRSRGVIGIERFSLVGRGGKRPGAGRKRKGERARVTHASRPALSSRHPVLVTMTLCEGLPSLRKPDVRAVLLRAIAAGSDRPGFRLVHFSLQTNHIHGIAEARDETALSRGMQGIQVRIARALNKHWRRKGKVFADRFHERILRENREVRNALVYTLQNVRKHGVLVDGPDPYSSGPWFDGWRSDRIGTDPLASRASSARRIATVPGLGPRPTPRPKTWLLVRGWRQLGLIGLDEGPVVRRAGGRSGLFTSGSAVRSA